MPKLHTKRFFWFVGIVAAFVAATFGVHALQAGRIASALLHQADRYEKDDNRGQMARYLARYLEMRPDDVDVRARYAQAISDDRALSHAKVGAYLQAFLQLERVLNQLPLRHDLRARAVRIAIDLGRGAEARGHLKILKEAQPDDGDVEALFARLEESEKHWQEAAGWWENSVKHAPGNIDGYVRLAALYRQHPWPPKEKELAEEAVGVLDRMVENNPKSARACLARWQSRSQDELAKDQALLDKAGIDVERALELAPNEADTLLAAADYALLRDKIDDARNYLRQARERFPEDVRVYRKQAGLEIQLKNTDSAVTILRTAAQALSGDGKIEMLWALCNLFIDTNKTDDAFALLDELKAAGASSIANDYLRGRIEGRRGNWSEAVKCLERAREAMVADTDAATRSGPLLGQTDFLLAQCYDQLNVPDQQINSLDRELRRNPDSVQALLGKAKVLISGGRLADALESYDHVIHLADAPATAWTERVRLMMTLSVQTGRPSWKTVESALAEAAGKAPNGPEIVLLQVQALVVRSRMEKSEAESKKSMEAARALLEKVCGERPEWAEVWAGRASLADLEKAPDKVAAIWREAAEKGGDTPELWVAQARYWSQNADRDGAARELDRLAKRVHGPLSSGSESTLLSELADANFRISRYKEAGALWSRLAAMPDRKNDLRLRVLLFQVAYQTKDDDGMQQAVRDLEAIEGKGTLSSYCAAIRLILRGKEGNLGCLDEAAVKLEEIGRRRPTWSAVPLAKAELAEILATQKNSTEEAARSVEQYRAAIRLGERSPGVVRRMVEQLYKLQRNDEAYEEIRKLQAETQSSDLQRLTVAILLARQETTLALTEAAKAVTPGSTDYRDQLWLGQVYLASGQRSQLPKARQHLEKALEFGRDKPECWQAMVQYLVASNQMAEAKRIAAQAETQLPGNESILTLAQCFEAVGNLDKANELYQKALKTPGTNGQVEQLVVQFYLRSRRTDEAIAVLRTLKDRTGAEVAASATWARRTLALTLAGSDDYRRFPEALLLIGLKIENGKIVEEAVPAGDDANEERRARARVLANQPRRALRQFAIGLIEGLGSQQTDDDRFLLARLYEASGANGWPKARDLLSALATKSGSPAVVAYFAQACLRQKDFATAEPMIARLESAEKDRQMVSGGLGSIELRAQLLELRGDIAPASEKLRAYLDQADAVRPRFERLLLLVQFLGRQRQYAEALELCRGARNDKEMPPAVITGATLALLRQSNAKANECAEFETWLRDQLQKSPNAPFLMLGLADLFNFTERYEQAEEQYRAVLKAHPNSPEALNNLAWLLAMHSGKCQEALDTIGRAIEIWGPRPQLLDTRVTVFLKMGKTEDALRDAETANADQTSAAWLFNLSQAQWTAKNSKAAAEAFKRAKEAGLKMEQLHPLDRPTFAQLAKELDQR
jgi:tetratricopeptide (TPR) repeat protein